MEEDSILISQMASTVEAVAYAKSIENKVKAETKTGWYTYEKPKAIILERDPEYIKKGVKMLQTMYGQKLTAYLCDIKTPSVIGRWVKGTATPNSFQKQKVKDIIEITEILLGKITSKQCKEWWVTPNEYLMYCLPMDEVQHVPQSVKRAALTLYT